LATNAGLSLARKPCAGGRFEQADGGTLFLDEIGDMPFDLQTRLLRVLSDGSFYRVGGHSAIKTNVRIIAATHQDLEQRVKEGGFREDLFHRLNVIRLRLPALRERREDVPALTKHFLQQSAKQLGVEPKRIAPAALARLSQFAFPGNVRQLENVCHWLTVMAPTQVIDEKDLPPEVLGSESHASPASSPSSGFPAGATAAHHAAPPVEITTDLIAARAVEIRPTAQNGFDTRMPEPVVQATAFYDPLSPHTQVSSLPALAVGAGWEADLTAQALAALALDKGDVWDNFTARFERTLIQAALSTTRNRRIEAAVKLGIGRNTITRKIAELGLE
jgi:two-component system, NtrC family, nitrogen regulation response regulator GlnG